MAKLPVTRHKIRPMTSPQLGRWGETRFATICTEACLVPHRPDYDLNGWDFFVEFPHIVAEADSDIAGRQQPLQCFVQVKTVWEGRPEVNLGLSAAARLGKSSLPSFLCILEASQERVVSRLHIFHMSGPLLERVLQKLREMQAKRQTTLINKVGFIVPVPRAPKGLQPTGAALRRAIEEAVGPDHAAYRRNKDIFLRTAGFPTTPVTGTITVRAESQAEYLDFQLGLKPLPISAFEAVETRWGISVPLKLNGTPITVRAVPKPHDVEVVWRCINTSKSVRLKMQAVVASGSDIASDGDHWILSHPNLDLKINESSYRIRMKEFDTVQTGYRTLVQLHALEELLASDGPVETQLLVRDKLIVAWRHNEPHELRSREASTALGRILQELELVLLSAGLQDIQLPKSSWKEWQEQLWRLSSILRMSDSIALSLTLDVRDGSVFGDEEHEMLYISALEFDDHLLAYYSTCRARLELEDLLRRWRLHASDFMVRDLRMLEKSEGAMDTFAKEAEAVTGLTTAIRMWGTLPKILIL